MKVCLVIASLLPASADGLVAGIAQIKRAYDLGINTFDTADIYSNGLSEFTLGKAIKQHNLPRDEIVVMTSDFLPILSLRRRLLTLLQSFMHL